MGKKELGQFSNQFGTFPTLFPSTSQPLNQKYFRRRKYLFGLLIVCLMIVHVKTPLNHLIKFVTIKRFELYRFHDENN